MISDRALCQKPFVDALSATAAVAVRPIADLATTAGACTSASVPAAAAAAITSASASAAAVASDPDE